MTKLHNINGRDIFQKVNRIDLVTEIFNLKQRVTVTFCFSKHDWDRGNIGRTNEYWFLKATLYYSLFKQKLC